MATKNPPTEGRYSKRISLCLRLSSKAVRHWRGQWTWLTGYTSSGIQLRDSAGLSPASPVKPFRAPSPKLLSC